MNVRKSIDYSTLFERIDAVLAAGLPQMETYREIGRLIAERTEKGAAVAVAEHLQQARPDISGFSARNVRRMREFYIAYQSNPEAMNAAMEIGWTQNVVIIEADLARDERMWYIRAARQFDWSKLTLTEKIKACAHMQLDLDTGTESCYTDSIETMEEAHDESALCVPREYLQKPDGRVCDNRGIS